MPQLRPSQGITHTQLRIVNLISLIINRKAIIRRFSSQLRDLKYKNFMVLLHEMY